VQPWLCKQARIGNRERVGDGHGVQ
jgi:hypothetical protein